eukprot:g48881.t1
MSDLTQAWACPRCTLTNEGEVFVCGACLGPKPLFPSRPMASPLLSIRDEKTTANGKKRLRKTKKFEKLDKPEEKEKKGAFQHLLFENDFSDIVFEVGHEQKEMIPAHRLVLSLASSRFGQMLHPEALYPPDMPVDGYVTYVSLQRHSHRSSSHGRSTRLSTHSARSPSSSPGEIKTHATTTTTTTSSSAVTQTSPTLIIDGPATVRSATPPPHELVSSAGPDQSLSRSSSLGPDQLISRTSSQDEPASPVPSAAPNGHASPAPPATPSTPPKHKDIISRIRRRRRTDQHGRTVFVFPPEVPSAAVKVLLQVLYDARTDGPAELATLQGLEVLWTLGRDFAVEKLHTLMLEDLRRRLTPATCLEYFPLLSSLDQELGRHILQLIADDTAAVIESPAFLQLNAASLLVLFSSSHLKIAESALFLRLLDWGLHQVKEKKSINCAFPTDLPDGPPSCPVHSALSALPGPALLSLPPAPPTPPPLPSFTQFAPSPTSPFPPPPPPLPPSFSVKSYGSSYTYKPGLAESLEQAKRELTQTGLLTQKYSWLPSGFTGLNGLHHSEFKNPYASPQEGPQSESWHTVMTMTPQEKKELLAEVELPLSLIRFPLMTQQELARLVVPLNLVSDAFLVPVFRYLSKQKDKKSVASGVSSPTKAPQSPNSGDEAEEVLPPELQGLQLDDLSPTMIQQLKLQTQPRGNNISFFRGLLRELDRSARKHAQQHSRHSQASACYHSLVKSLLNFTVWSPRHAAAPSPPAASVPYFNPCPVGGPQHPDKSVLFATGNGRVTGSWLLHEKQACPPEEPDIDIIIDNLFPSHFCEACVEDIWVGHITSESLQQRFDTLQWHKLSCS